MMNKKENKEEIGSKKSIFNSNKIYLWLMLLIFTIPSTISLTGDSSDSFEINIPGSTTVKYRYSRVDECWERNGDCPSGSPDWTGWDCVYVDNVNECSGNPSYSSYHENLATELKYQSELAGVTFLKKAYNLADSGEEGSGDFKDGEWDCSLRGYDVDEKGMYSFINCDDTWLFGIFDTDLEISSRVTMLDGNLNDVMVLSGGDFEMLSGSIDSLSLRGGQGYISSIFIIEDEVISGGSLAISSEFNPGDADIGSGSKTGITWPGYGPKQVQSSTMMPLWIFPGLGSHNYYEWEKSSELLQEFGLSREHLEQFLTKLKENVNEKIQQKLTVLCRDSDLWKLSAYCLTGSTEHFEYDIEFLTFGGSLTNELGRVLGGTNWNYVKEEDIAKFDEIKIIFTLEISGNPFLNDLQVENNIPPIILETRISGQEFWNQLTDSSTTCSIFSIT